ARSSRGSRSGSSSTSRRRSRRPRSASPSSRRSPSPSAWASSGPSASSAGSPCPSCAASRSGPPGPRGPGYHCHWSGPPPPQESTGPGPAPRSPMTVVHVRITCSDDYVARRIAELFYRVPDAGALRSLVEEDPYYRAGAWTGYVPRSFETFVEPWDPEPPVVLDGSRPALVVEGPTADRDMAQLALVELRGAGRVAFGGFLPDGTTVAVARTTDANE